LLVTSAKYASAVVAETIAKEINSNPCLSGLLDGHSAAFFICVALSSRVSNGVAVVGAEGLSQANRAV
jgi:hypothetical protein